MENSFWQAPGNGKGFDSFLGDNSKMNNRTIGVLSYIKEKSEIEGFVSESRFDDDIKDYLLDNFNENPNDSLGTHFYKPALFYGFIIRNKDYNLSLSIEGNLFLKYYNQGNFQECKKLIINQLDDTTYPNAATPKVKKLKLFPFRILFKLLLENKYIKSNFISEKLVHIKKYEDLKEYEKTKDINKIKRFDVSGSSKYYKFNTWVINSLVSLEILVLNDKKLHINEDVLEHLNMLYKNISYKEMFFENSIYEVNNTVSKKRVKRDGRLPERAKQRDNFICIISDTHRTFLLKNKNYVEGHHIIPMYQQKNYNFNLDKLENIASLCPNCHKEVHLADDKKKILDTIYTKYSKYLINQNITKVDLYRIYNCL